MGIRKFTIALGAKGMAGIALALVTPAFMMTYWQPLKNNERWKYYDLWAKGVSPLEADADALKGTKGHPARAWLKEAKDMESKGEVPQDLPHK